jgi:uncharacterized protein YukE
MLQAIPAELRDAARRYRDDAAESLRRAAIQLQVPEQRFGVEEAFDQHTTAAPYRDYIGAMKQEITLLERATHQMADELDQAATDYEAADRQAAQTMAGR